MLKTKNIRAIACLTLLGGLNLAGCGQTGPLYMPPKVAQPVAPAVAVAHLPIIAPVRVS
jgi:predicted small lipoprotein YifL